MNLRATCFLGLWLLSSCSQSEADKYFGSSRHDNCYEKPANDPCYKEPQPTPITARHHWYDSSQNPAECFAKEAAELEPCMGKNGNEFHECIGVIERRDEAIKIPRQSEK